MHNKLTKQVHGASAYMVGDDSFLAHNDKAKLESAVKAIVDEY